MESGYLYFAASTAPIAGNWPEINTTEHGNGGFQSCLKIWPVCAVTEPTNSEREPFQVCPVTKFLTKEEKAMQHH